MAMMAIKSMGLLRELFYSNKLSFIGSLRLIDLT